MDTSLQPAVNLVEDLDFATVVNESGAQETLRLDIYQPVGAAPGLRPAILWFHGGGFTTGNDKRQVYIPRFARAFAAQGYVGIAPDYRVRVSPNSDRPGAINDAVSDGHQALAWVIAHAAEYQIDPQRIILAGGSAGGMLVTHMVHASPAPLPGVIGLVNLWGTPGGAMRLFQGVNPHAPATFTTHGTADALVPYENSTSFLAELQQAGIRCQLLTLPGAPHTPLMHFDQIAAAVAEFLKTL